VMNMCWFVVEKGFVFFFCCVRGGGWGGGGIEARPGTEKQCSHKLQNGPVKTWKGVFVTIQIDTIDRSTSVEQFSKFMCILSRERKC